MAVWEPALFSPALVLAPPCRAAASRRPQITHVRFLRVQPFKPRLMPVDMVISPLEDSFWQEAQDGQMRLKIRVRRMKEGRELRAWQDFMRGDEGEGAGVSEALITSCRAALGGGCDIEVFDIAPQPRGLPPRQSRFERDLTVAGGRSSDTSCCSLTT
ncbi:hypothetical protein AAFF_G00300880 [Aldrovandia affinis]|uniref:Uncharacterized protein n=1 Tax=Aldrovandia affinis TaxID=143900 RepID=A0AAD7WSA6_9TELE|nr:hypothetical protein AAFF_G00300880 [Aldrovandia affinis]